VVKAVEQRDRGRGHLVDDRQTGIAQQRVSRIALGGLSAAQPGQEHATSGISAGVFGITGDQAIKRLDGLGGAAETFGQHMRFVFQRRSPRPRRVLIVAATAAAG
jgi:hypothetical protein